MQDPKPDVEHAHEASPPFAVKRRGLATAGFLEPPVWRRETEPSGPNRMTILRAVERAIAATARPFHKPDESRVSINMYIILRKFILCRGLDHGDTPP
ncbi:hypothetical protein MPL3356_110274 [Mesorhizobium plurifarium]|uniref:Uncharacterized protein n=1 Tax=Mesorhizobium plurifarium TaxID=69974 RepID=A0A090DEV7_MESPL|nr:hypothetical protein MPL3356_110274 [Mesorhizobium plurifarium]